MKKFISLTCPSCGGQLTQQSIERFKCQYCGNDHFIQLDEKGVDTPDPDAPTMADKVIADEVRYQRFLQTQYLPLEKKSKDLWQLTMIGFAAVFFFFPAAVVIWLVSTVQSFQALRYQRFEGDAEPRAKIERSLWLSLIMAVCVSGCITTMLAINAASTLMANFL